MDIGERLAELRRAHVPPLTQEVVADRAQCSSDTVRKIEQGIRKPSIATLERLAAALDVDSLALLADETRTHFSGSDDAAEIRETSSQLVRLETLHGGDDVFPLALRAFRAASSELETARTGVTDLEAATGELAEVAAWIAYDAAHIDESRNLIHEALLLSRTARDRDMELLELGHLSMLALDAKRNREALRIADETLDNNRLTPRVSALFYLRRARALGQRGESARAKAALDDADGSIHESSRVTDPAWTWWLDPSEIAWHRAMTATELGDHRRAVDHHLDSLAKAPRKVGRHTFVASAFLLDSLAKVNAWADAEPVLIGLSNRLGDVQSTRTIRVLQRAVSRITRAERIPSTVADAARELEEHLQGL